MSAPLVQRSAVRFEFVGHGSSSCAETARRDRLWIDVGNELRPAVVDQHHLPAYTGSTTSLVLANPDLVIGAARSDRSTGDPFTIVLHEDPDLDSVSASFLAMSLLETRRFPEGSDALARYVDHVDQGYPGFSEAKPYTLYSACMLIAHRLAQRNWRSPHHRWLKTAEEGVQVVQWLLGEALGHQAIDDVDAFACPELFAQRDRDEVLSDLRRYKEKLLNPACRVRRLSLELPGQFGGVQAVDTLLVRDVQNANDPERVIYFKDWARTDGSSPSGGGFVALAVFHSEGGGSRRRSILSVRPGSGRSLKGLGAELDIAEAEARRRSSPTAGEGSDLETRPGFDSADPWYDGRGHAYTIVDAPRSGTLLDADEVENIFIRFGRRSPDEALAIELPQPDDLRAAPGLDRGALASLSAVATEGALRHETLHAPAPDVFISYPGTKLKWVREHLFEPLVRCASGQPLRVFFDKESLVAGSLWPAALADAIARSRLFVALYCEDYFRSNFCQWELQLAIVRDPIGKNGLILPLALDDVSLPPYCSLLHAEQLKDPESGGNAAEFVRRRLARGR